MKQNRFLAGLILMVLLGFCQMAGRESAWREGRQLYAEGRFQEALERFDGLLSESDHWRIHYNIGNCLYKLDRFLEAKISYARAWKIAPGQRSILKNLSVVNSRLGFTDELLKQTLFEKGLGMIDGVLSPGLGAALLILSLFLFNGSLFLWMRRRLIRPARYIFVVSLLLIIILGAYTFHGRAAIERHDLAVVHDSAASLFSGPGEHHTALFSLPQGLIVHIQERGAKWLRVKAGKDVSGWIKPEWLTLL